MSAQINIIRLGRLARRHYADEGRACLWNAAGLTGFFILHNIFCINVDEDLRSRPAEMAIFIMLPLLAGLLAQAFVSAGRNLKKYERPSQRVLALTLPASTAEKYLFAWLDSAVVSLAVFMLLSFGVSSVFNWLAPDRVIGGFTDFVGADDTLVQLGVYAAIQQTVLCCRIVWGRWVVPGFILLWLGIGLLRRAAASVFALCGMPISCKGWLLVSFTGAAFWWALWAVLFVAGLFLFARKQVR